MSAVGRTAGAGAGPPGMVRTVAKRCPRELPRWPPPRPARRAWHAAGAASYWTGPQWSRSAHGRPHERPAGAVTRQLLGSTAAASSPAPSTSCFGPPPPPRHHSIVFHFCPPSPARAPSPPLWHRLRRCTPFLIHRCAPAPPQWPPPGPSPLGRRAPSGGPAPWDTPPPPHSLPSGPASPSRPPRTKRTLASFLVSSKGVWPRTRGPALPSLPNSPPPLPPLPAAYRTLKTSHASTSQLNTPPATAANTAAQGATSAPCDPPSPASALPAPEAPPAPAPAPAPASLGASLGAPPAAETPQAEAPQAAAGRARRPSLLRAVPGAAALLAGGGLDPAGDDEYRWAARF
jgi:hypothetical protein